MLVLAALATSLSHNPRVAVAHFRKAALPRPALAVIKAGMQAPAFALGLLVVAALGGFVLLGSHLRGRALPSGLVVGHALLAAEFVLTS